MACQVLPQWQQTNSITTNQRKTTMKLIRYDYPTLSRFDALNQLFDQFFGDVPRSPWSGLENRVFTPAVDLYEDENAFHARFEIPGVKKSDLRVELENSVLTVSAQSSDKKDKTEQSFSFSRSISVPDGIDADKVRARYEDGILTVSMPKAEARKPKAIEVR